MEGKRSDSLVRCVSISHERSEMIVHADPKDVVAQPGGVRLTEGPDLVNVAGVDVEILELCTPLRHEHPFHAAADRPARTGLGAADSDARQGHAALELPIGQAAGHVN